MQNCAAVTATDEILINSLTNQIEALWFLFPVLLVRTGISMSTMVFNFGKPCLEVKWSNPGNMRIFQLL